MKQKKKDKNVDERLLKKFLITIKMLNFFFFCCASKVDKEESEPKQKSDLSIPKWVQVSEDRFNFIKSKINEKRLIYCDRQ